MRLIIFWAWAREALESPRKRMRTDILVRNPTYLGSEASHCPLSPREIVRVNPFIARTELTPRTTLMRCQNTLHWVPRIGRHDQIATRLHVTAASDRLASPAMQSCSKLRNPFLECSRHSPHSWKSMSALPTRRFDQAHLVLRLSATPVPRKASRTKCQGPLQRAFFRPREEPRRASKTCRTNDAGGAVPGAGSMPAGCHR
jgi:hypothetical protein